MRAKQHLRSLSCVFVLLLVGSLLMGSTWQRPSWQRASRTDSPLFRLSLTKSMARLEDKIRTYFSGSLRVVSTVAGVCPAEPATQDPYDPNCSSVDLCHHTTDTIQDCETCSGYPGCPPTYDPQSPTCTFPTCKAPCPD